MELAVAIIAGLICICGAIGVIGFRNPVHNALSLVATLFGVAVIFIAQGAYFLAAIQVIVYAGAIVVVFLFVIMLLGVDKVERLERFAVSPQQIAAVLAGMALHIALLVAMLAGTPSLTGRRGEGLSGTDINELAKQVFTANVWAFEITSILLGIAVVAAVLLVSQSDEPAIDEDDYPETESRFEEDQHDAVAGPRVEWEIDEPTVRPVTTGGES